MRSSKRLKRIWGTASLQMKPTCRSGISWEGLFDTLSLTAAGYPRVVAILPACMAGAGGGRGRCGRSYWPWMRTLQALRAGGGQGCFGENESLSCPPGHGGHKDANPDLGEGRADCGRPVHGSEQLKPVPQIRRPLIVSEQEQDIMPEG